MEATNSTLLVTIGLPGSGKTTFCTQLAQESGAVHLCLDHIYKQNLGNRGEEITADETAKIWRFSRSCLLELCRDHLQSQSRVIIVDDNFELNSMRKPYFRLAQEYKSKLGFLFFDTPLETCLLRNQQRQD